MPQTKSLATSFVSHVIEFFLGPQPEKEVDEPVGGMDAATINGGGPPPCGCSHQQFATFSESQECASRSVPSSFGFLGGAVLSVTIPPMASALLGPLVFKPTVSVVETTMNGVAVACSLQVALHFASSGVRSRRVVQVEGRHDTVLFLRNNLTVVEPIWITGEAEGPSVVLVDPDVWESYSRFKKFSRRTVRPELAPVTTVRLVVKNDGDGRSGVLVARRSFLLVNTGNLNVHVCCGAWDEGGAGGGGGN